MKNSNCVPDFEKKKQNKMYSTHTSRVRLLYKTILRLHKALPAELQPLGNTYARDEFKRHKNCNETEAKIFMVEWTNYAVQLSQQLGLGVRGKPKGEIGANLKIEDLDKFAEDQIVQLHELMKAATEIDDTVPDTTSSSSPDDDKSNKS